MTIASNLLSPFSFSGLNLANRVVLAPMTRARAGERRVPNLLMAEYYAQRASAGLLLTEATVISAIANGWIGTPGIYTEEMTEGWSQVVNHVHAAGGIIFLQLWHCGRASHSSFLPDGQPPFAPSAIPIQGDYIHTPVGKMPYETPRAMTTADIQTTLDDYRQAALRAKQAGFDGVEVHAANGYLIDEFLQSKTNHRNDDYGGNLENRYRFLGEVVQAVTSVWPANRVGVLLSPNGVYNDMGSPDFRPTFLHAAEQLQKAGIGYLHLLDGLAFGFHGFGEPMTLAEFRKVFTGTIIGNCGYTQATAETAISSGLADLISFGRPFISNPDLVARFANGWPLAETAPVSTWYAPNSAGYTDFPVYQAKS